MEEREWQSPLLQEIVNRVAAALNIELPSNQRPASSDFDDEAGGWSTHFLMFRLSGFEEVVRKQFQTLSSAGRWSGLCKRLASLHSQETIGWGPLPPLDQTMAQEVEQVVHVSKCP